MHMEDLLRRVPKLHNPRRSPTCALSSSVCIWFVMVSLNIGRSRWRTTIVTTNVVVNILHWQSVVYFCYFCPVGCGTWLASAARGSRPCVQAKTNVKTAEYLSLGLHAKTNIRERCVKECRPLIVPGIYVYIYIGINTILRFKVAANLIPH